jgi:predicted dienelactone hydrolase
MMIGSKDGTIREAGNARNRAYYEASKGPHYLVEIKDGGHYSFTSVDQYNTEYGNGIGKGFLDINETHKLVNAYAFAFLEKYVRGESGYEPFLKSNHYGEEIIYKASE